EKFTPIAERTRRSPNRGNAGRRGCAWLRWMTSTRRAASSKMRRQPSGRARSCRGRQCLYDSQMRYRTFGRTGWQVSGIGEGMWGMGGWTGSDDQESLRALERAIERGCNFFDTAWAYGQGHSERLLGQILKGTGRGRVGDRSLYVATKVPPKNLTWPGKAEIPISEGFPPDHIREYTEQSLNNLAVDTTNLQH